MLKPTQHRRHVDLQPKVVRQKPQHRFVLQLVPFTEPEKLLDAVVQVGTNLAMGEVAAMAEFWLDKPVLAINTATYWYALRYYGIKDQMQGWGRLMAEH